jgi:hypothetical protein
LFLEVKFTQSLFGKSVTSFACFFRRIVVSDYVFNASDFDLCTPPMCGRFPHAFEAAGVVDLHAFIMHVLKRLRLSKITPFVVSLIPINMIYLEFRPFTGHPQPDDPMRQIMLPIDDDTNVPFQRLRTDRITLFVAAVWRYAVRQLPCPRFVPEPISDKISREIGVGVLVPSDHLAFLQPLVRAFNRLAFWRFAHVPFVRFAVPSSPPKLVVIAFDYARPTIQAAYSTTMNYWSRLVDITTKVFFNLEPAVAHAGTLAQMPLLVN